MTVSSTPVSRPHTELVRETIAAIESYLALRPAFHAPSSRLAGTRRAPGRPRPRSASPAPAGSTR